MKEKPRRAWVPSHMDTEWLAELFEYELCHECGGDSEHHDVVPTPTGQRFARCKFPPDDDGNRDPRIKVED